jgi:hypothetical protein
MVNPHCRIYGKIEEFEIISIGNFDMEATSRV